MVTPADPHWYSAVEAPRTVSDSATLEWQGEADVVVLGLGAAALAAALAASETGAAVVLCGAAPTARDAGLLYAGATEWQRANACADDADSMQRDIRAALRDVPGEALLRPLCEASPALLHWLEGLGVEFSASLADPASGPNPAPARGSYLGWVGADAAAPRGHRVFGGDSVTARLRQSAARAGIDSVQPCWPQRLVLAADGAVLGVELLRFAPGSAAERRYRWLSMLLAHWPAGWCESARRHLRARLERLRQQAQSPWRLRARAGVVIADGGYGGNAPMLSLPADYAAALVGDDDGDGSGIRLGQSAGGCVYDLERIDVRRDTGLLPALCDGLLVGLDGARLPWPLASGADLGNRLLAADGRAWLVLDHAGYRRALSQAWPWGPWGWRALPALCALLQARRAASPEALAGRCAIDETALLASVHAWVGTRARESGAAGAGPWYGIDLSLDSRAWPCRVAGRGGLCTAPESGAVLDAAGRAIPGLYAAGASSGGLCSHHGIPGLALTASLLGGRWAGRHCARRLERGTILDEVALDEAAPDEAAPDEAIQEKAMTQEKATT